MNNWKQLLGSAAFAALSVGIVQQAEAQLTSSQINGRVVDGAGAPVANAVVSITHVPSGQVKTATTSADGVYFEPGLRVGGPYEVSTVVGADTVSRTDIFLQPGAGNTINLSGEALRQLDTIVITASSMSVDLANGVGSSYTADDILNQPSVQRDLLATVNRDPLALNTGEGILSVAGQNPRFNGLSIDGSLQQEDFGLSSSTYATTRSPINLDAVESVSLLASDYSVTTTGFTGGLVNVTTKSGTNDFHGSAFYFKRDEDYLGNAAFDQFITQPAFDEKEYGVTLGGPIIKDKLFFFGSYDKFESGSSINFTSSDANNGINPAIFDTLNTVVQDTYGIDMGGRPTQASLPITSERILGKIDWNITDNHRASFSYQNTKEEQTSVSSSSFTSAWYALPIELTAYNAELFSDWTNNLSTQLRVNYKEFVKGQNCGLPNVGELSFTLAYDDLVGTPLEGMILNPGDDVTLQGGCDRYRHGNEYDDSRLQIFGAANYTLGSHLITAGADWETFELYNLFMQRSNGVYTFSSYQDLLDGNAAISYWNATSNNKADAAAAWGYDKLSLFVGDQWQVRPDLRLDYGVRYERFLQSDKPEASVAFADTYGFASSNNLDGKDLIQPRVSFEYTPLDRTTVSGGFGLFAGGDPKVWISAAFTPLFATTGGTFTNVDPSNVPDVLLTNIANTDQSALLPLDIIAPGFEIPSDWKASLKLDQEFDLVFGDMNFGSNYLVTAQVLYSQVNEGFLWTNLSQTEQAGSLPTGVAPDGRPIYADLQAQGVANVTQLGNFSGGASTTYTVALSNAFENGLDFTVSYAYQDAEGTTEGTSSRGISNWRGISAIDRNNPETGRSYFETEHAFKISLGYEKEIFGDLTSTFNLFGQATSGEPYSYMFNVSNNNSLFGRAGQGENPYDNSPLYVPSYSATGFSDPNVVFASTFDEDGFLQLARSAGLPNGGIDARYSHSTTWNQRWDFQYAQELPFSSFGWSTLEDANVKFFVNVENIANLLNDEWGTQYGRSSFGQLPVVTADLVSAADVAANGVDGAAALTGDAPRTTCTTSDACVYRYNYFNNRSTGYENYTDSVYSVRLGLRFEF